MNISIILAAGEGTRMNSKLPKVLHQVNGKPLLDYVIKASISADVEKTVVIVGHGGEKVKEYFADEKIFFKTQPIGEGVPYGTGFAVMQGLEHIEDDSNVVILYGDTPLITTKTIEALIEYHRSQSLDGTVLTANLDNPTGYGRIIREDNGGDILKIVEHKDATEEELEIKEINSGIYCFKGKALKEALKKIDNNNIQNEYYITDVIGILKSSGHKVGAYIIQDSIEIHGINSKEQLAFAEGVIRKRVNEQHMVNGVTIINPDHTYIGNEVKIGRDTIIYPGTILEGKTEIGEDCIIGENSRIIDSIIEDKVEIHSSTIRESTVGNSSSIGPYAQLRPNSRLGNNIKIGNFVEVKNATIGDNSKAGHLSYIGDAEVGKDVNIGCGVVFVNYNGIEKFKTIVGDEAFIGSNSNLVAPVIIENRAYIAAGSTITKTVEEGALSIARAHQSNKLGWVDKKGYKKHK